MDSNTAIVASATPAAPGSSDWQKHLRISRSDNHGEMAAALMGTGGSGGDGMANNNSNSGDPK
jgi:hypothetical protein